MTEATGWTGALHCDELVQMEKLCTRCERLAEIADGPSDGFTLSKLLWYCGK